MTNESGLSRWSRMKRANAKPAVADAVAVAPPAPAEDLPAVVEDDKPVPVAVEDLPDPDTLDKDSDFSVFLGDHVPAELRRRAMSALWRSDPVFAHLDGLNDYDQDFSLIETLGEAVKTAYQVGKGYLEDDEDEDAVAAETAPDSPPKAIDEETVADAEDDEDELADDGDLSA